MPPRPAHGVAARSDPVPAARPSQSSPIAWTSSPARAAAGALRGSACSELHRRDPAPFPLSRTSESAQPRLSRQFLLRPECCLRCRPAAPYSRRLFPPALRAAPALLLRQRLRHLWRRRSWSLACGYFSPRAASCPCHCSRSALRSLAWPPAWRWFRSHRPLRSPFPPG